MFKEDRCTQVFGQPPKRGYQAEQWLYPICPSRGNVVDAATRSRRVLLGLLGYALLRHLMTGTPEGMAQAAIEEGER